MMILVLSHWLGSVLIFLYCTRLESGKTVLGSVPGGFGLGLVSFLLGMNKIGQTSVAQSINQSIKFYLYSPYSQTTVRLIGL